MIRGDALFLYCTHCSKLALDVGLAFFGLWHEDGPKLYDTLTYNDLSYAWKAESN